jgi:hypothetical protein
MLHHRSPSEFLGGRCNQMQQCGIGMPQNRNVELMWRMILSGGILLRGQRRLLRLIPGTKRCKNCLAPLEGVGVPLMRLLGRGSFEHNPRFCTF